MDKPLRPVITIRLFREERCYGAGIDSLLRGVEIHHSLRASAKAMDMAYSKAWTTVRRCEEQLGFSLLERSVGGKNGGGAALTPEARAIMAAYARYCAALRATAEALFQQEFQEFMKSDGI